MKCTFLTLLGLLIVTTWMPTPAEACMGNWCCETDGNTTFCYPCLVAGEPTTEDASVIPWQTLVEFTSPDTARITLQDYVTTTLTTTTECLTAIAPLRSVEELTAVTNYDGRSFSPFEVVTFVPSSIAGAEAGVLAQEHGYATDSRPWLGFESRITGEVADGVPNYFILDVKLRKGVSPAAFLRELETEGVFVTGSTQVTPGHEGHLYFRDISTTEVYVRLPTPYAGKGRPLDLPNAH